MDLDRLKFVIKDEQGTTYKDCAKAIKKKESDYVMDQEQNYKAKLIELISQLDSKSTLKYIYHVVSIYLQSRDLVK